MRAEKLNRNWPKESYLELLLLQQCLLKQSEKRANLILNTTLTANFVVILMTKVSALPLEKIAMHAVVRTTLNLNAKVSQERPMDLSQSVTQEKGQMEPGKIDAVCMKYRSVIKIAQWRT